MFTLNPSPPLIGQHLISLENKNVYFRLFALIFLSFMIRIIFLGQHNLLVEEAYYWNYAAHLDFGYLDHPPMVALLIKLSTLIFGNTEFGVRFPGLICWSITAYFSYLWCERIQPHSGGFAVLLLSILPFFFLNSMIMTPDLPLIATWSAALYFLYCALLRQESRAWYGVGLSFGLGLLAKYSIVLLMGAAGLYLLSQAETRIWLRRKEPYLAVLIALLLFSPVIYWNATHDWMSFAFQSTRRFSGKFCFSLPEFIGFFVLFFTPVGLLSLKDLLFRASKSSRNPALLIFIKFHAWIPLLVFACFSIRREIKWNWIGPSLLAFLPWIAGWMAENLKIYKLWLKTSYILLPAYLFLIITICFGRPAFMNATFLSKLVSWDKLTQDFYQIAAQNMTHEPPVFVPLDTYSILSELNFYQMKQFQSHPHLKPFPIHHAGLFDYNGLMYEFWNNDTLHGKKLILIGRDLKAFDNGLVLEYTHPISKIKKIWGKSQKALNNVRPYYYQIVYMP